MNDVVGHKTFSNGDGTYRHEPLFADEANALMDRVEKNRAAREALMPTVQDALNAMTEAYIRLIR